MAEQAGRSGRVAGRRAAPLVALLPTLALASAALASGVEDFDDQQDLDTLTRLDPVAARLGSGAYVAWSFPSRGGDDYAYRIEADASASGGAAGASRAMSVFSGLGARDFAASVSLRNWSQSRGDVSIGVGALRDLGPGATDGYALVVRPAAGRLELVRFDDERPTPLASAAIALDPSAEYRLGLVRTGPQLEGRVHPIGSQSPIASLSATATTNWTDLEAGVLIVGSTDSDVGEAEFDRLFGGAPTADADFDGVSDGAEVLQGSDPATAAAGAPDPDGDGLASTFELAVGTDPLDADSDDDGLSDGFELATGSFQAKRVIASQATGARSVAVGDLDDDGDPDVVSAATNANRVAWHENLGDGTFGSERVLSATSLGAFNVLLADVDGDGDLDVVASSLFDQELIWFENLDGRGDFAGESLIASGVSGALSLDAADLDGDGDPDLLLASVTDGHLTWYENTGGAGGFSPRTIASAVAQPFWVAARDLDGDADLDVLAASMGDDTIAWYENTDGHGGFGPRQLVSQAPLQAAVLASADLDGDGDPDVLSTAGAAGNLSWHENQDGAGGFGALLPVATGVIDVSALLLADLDGDGDADVIATASSAQGTSWRENRDGAGSFGDGQSVGSEAEAGLAAVADIDGDGAPDVVRALFDSGEIVWYPQLNLADPLAPDSDGDGLGDGFEVAYGLAPLLADENANGISDGLEDFDADGLSNLAEQEALTDPRLADTDRDGLLDGAELTLGSDPNQLDTDGDGLLDAAEVASATDLLDPDSDGDGLLDGFEVRFGFDPTVGGDGDGDPDGDGLVNRDEQALHTDPYESDSDGDGETDADEALLYGTDPTDPDSDDDGLSDGFELAHAFDPLVPDEDENGFVDGNDDADGDGLSNAAESRAGTDPRDEDSDGDGLLDGLELGSGRFGAQRVISNLANGARAVRAADLDGDGDADVVTASAIDDEIAWYPNLGGAGVFGGQQLISSLADGAAAVFTADVDGDGDLDVLSASELDDEIAWYENLDGSGTFGPQRIISQQADGASSVFAGDLDGDGDADVLSASVNDGKLAWYANLDGAGGIWSERVIWQVPDGVRSVFAADLDGDGDLDALSASWRSNQIGWYENGDGQGSFGPRRVISSQASAAAAVSAADLDGDGDLDVLCASVFDDTVAWYENLDGTGTFGDERLVSDTVNEAWSASAADVDGDGDLDVLTASELGDELAWFENGDGSGSFEAGRVVSLQADGAAWIESADLDGDGDADVLAVSSFDDEVAWHEQLEVSDPRLVDSDGDGLADGLEDADGDGLDNRTEQALGTHALDSDSDGDGFGDGLEVQTDSDPLDPASNPSVQVPGVGGTALWWLVTGLLVGGRRARDRC